MVFDLVQLLAYVPRVVGKAIALAHFRTGALVGSLTRHPDGEPSPNPKHPLLMGSTEPLAGWLSVSAGGSALSATDRRGLAADCAPAGREEA